VRWLAFLLLALLPGIASAQIAGFPPGAFDNTAARAPAPAGYTGPLDAQSGASAVWFMAAGSAAIAAAGTQSIIQIGRGSDSHTCKVLVGSSGQMVTTVSSCSTSGDNGETIATWCATTTCYTVPASTGVSLYDQSGNTYDQHGFADLISSDPVLTTTNCSPAGKYCWQLSGSNYLAGVANANAANVFGPTAFTIVAWVYPTELNNSAQYSILGTDIATSFVLRLNGQSGNATGIMEADASGASLIGLATCTIPINSWSSVAFTYNVGTKAYAFYANGTTCGSGTNSGNNPYLGNTAHIWLGGDNANAGLKGLLRGEVTYAGTAYGAATTEAIMATGP